MENLKHRYKYRILYIILFQSIYSITTENQVDVLDGLNISKFPYVYELSTPVESKSTYNPLDFQYTKEMPPSEPYISPISKDFYMQFESLIKNEIGNNPEEISSIKESLVPYSVPVRPKSPLKVNKGSLVAGFIPPIALFSNIVLGRAMKDDIFDHEYLYMDEVDADLGLPMSASIHENVKSNKRIMFLSVCLLASAMYFANLAIQYIKQKKENKISLNTNPSLWSLERCILFIHILGAEKKSDMPGEYIHNSVKGKGLIARQALELSFSYRKKGLLKWLSRYTNSSKTEIIHIPKHRCYINPFQMENVYIREHHQNEKTTIGLSIRMNINPGFLKIKKENQKYTMNQAKLKSFRPNTHDLSALLNSSSKGNMDIGCYNQFQLAMHSHDISKTQCIFHFAMEDANLYLNMGYQALVFSKASLDKTHVPEFMLHNSNKLCAIKLPSLCRVFSPENITYTLRPVDSELLKTTQRLKNIIGNKISVYQFHIVRHPDIPRSLELDHHIHYQE